MLVIGCYIVGTVWSGAVNADEPFFNSQTGELLEAQIETNCSMNESIYQGCFGITKPECTVLFSEIYASCDQSPTSVLFNNTNQESINEFTNCVEVEFTNHVEAKGVDLNAICE